MNETEVVAVYSDGGCLGRNPSGAGGTWAWCWVSTPERVVDDPGTHIRRRRSGLLIPNPSGPGHLRALVSPVSNNHSEYAALALCLRNLPLGWSGTVYCDSQITLGRFFWGWKHENIPDGWQRQMREIIRRLGQVKPVLLDGHPTKAQLAQGVGKRGNPVSTFNALCDTWCNEQKARHLAGEGNG